MAQQNIDFGSFPDDPSADAIRTAFGKVQNNFNQLFGANANSAVTSINRTPGAGITVNYPTGNVILSANIACLQVATTSLKVGRGSDNTQSNVTITSSAQQLNIDVDPDQVLSNYFADVGNGLAIFKGTLNTDSNSQPNITTVGTLIDLSVSGNANLGNIYSDNIYYANGDPALTPAAGSTNQIQYNNSNQFDASANLTFNNATQVLSVNGSANVVKLNANGNINFTGANAYFSNVANLKIPGGTLGYYLQTDGTGNLDWAAGGGGGSGSPGGVNTNVQFNDTGTFGGNLGFTFNKITGIFTAPFLAGDGNGLANIQGANVTGFVPNANVANTALSVDGANVSGEVDYAAVANSVAGANVSGDVSGANHANIADSADSVAGGNVTGQVGNALIAGTVYTNAQPNITSLGTLTDLSVSGNANVTENLIVTGNLTVQGNATYYNVETLIVQDPLIDLGGGPNGAPPVSNSGYDLGITMQYYTTGAKIAYMGFDNSNAEFAFGKDVSVASEIITFNSFGNVRALTFLGSIEGPTANFSGNLTSANADLGNTATANFFVGRFYGNANAATVANTVVDNAQPNITSVGTLTSLGVTGNTTSGNFIGTLANGNSNIRIATDSSIGISAVGNSNVVVITGTGANVGGTLSVSGNATVGNLLGVLANGNSNISIPIANNSVTISSAGNANIIVVTGTGANVTGTLSVSGNTTTGGIKTDNYYYANGDSISFAGTYNNSNVSSFLAAFGSNTITTTGNVTAGNLNSSGTAGESFTILGSTPSANNTTGGVISITSGAGTGANLGGTVTIKAGDSGNATVSSQWGSGIDIIAGNTTAATGRGGNVKIYGGTGNGNASFSGIVALYGGRAEGGSGASGSYLILNGGRGNASGAGGSFNLNGGTSFGTDKAAVQAVIAGGVSTGNATPGNIIFQIGAVGSTGTTAQTLGTILTIDHTGITATGILSASGNANIGNIGTGGLITATGNISGANVIATSWHIRSVATGISANGISQATATALTKEINVVSTVSSGQGVILPTAVAGMILTITNTSANSLAVYPASGGAINSLAANAGFTQVAGATLQFIAPTTTQWYTTSATYA
jgi:hypothetical protein